jgi:alkylhydroperoxidase/carboxymuconolactone decarboxylase family protein YurZ
MTNILEKERIILKKNEAKAEQMIQILRKNFGGKIFPEFERCAQYDPDFFEWFNQIRPRCFVDGKMLPAKYRALIHMCLLAYRGEVKGVKERIRMAIGLGATKLEIVEAFETAMVAGGVPTLLNGMAGLIQYEESQSKQEK